MHQLISNQLVEPMKIGDNIQKNGWKLVLLQEVCNICKDDQKIVTNII